MRASGNASEINPVVMPARRRAVDLRVARGMDSAVQEMRCELEDDEEHAGDAAAGTNPDDDGLSEPQIRFLAAMRQRPSVGCAMRMAGVRFANLRKWRESARFRDLESEAIEIGKSVLFEALWRAAVEGDPVPVFSAGILVGTKRKYSDRCRELLAKALMPEAFDRKVMQGQPVGERVILGSAEEIAAVVRRLSPTSRPIERLLPCNATKTEA